MKTHYLLIKYVKYGAISPFISIFAQTIHDSNTEMKLRQIFLPILMMSFIIPARAQSMAGSSIASRTLLISDGTKKIEERVYDNGLGDIVQETLSYPGSSLPSVTVHHEYDEYRRRTKSWLPVTFSSGNGFIAGTTIASQAVSQYSDSAPFSRTEYDGFLPSQPSAEYKAGAQWQGNGKKVTVAYNEYVGSGLYAYEDGRLYKLQSRKYLRTLTTDEDGCWSAEYTDLGGRLLISETSQGKTYFVYNAKGDVSYVIPPALSQYIVSNFGPEPDCIPDTDDMMQKYAYVYRYDNQRHCIYKKLPGCEPVYYVYDKAGACILTQDGVQRQGGVWAYSIPDKFGRPCISGICHKSVSYSSEPLHAYHVYAEYNGSTTQTGGYTVHNFSLGNDPTLYSAAYYDSYDFIGNHGVPSSLTASNENGYSVDSSVGHGLPTGSATAIIKDGSVSGYTYSAIYYDSRYNVSQVNTVDHLGKNDITSTAYTYTGKPDKTRNRHRFDGTRSMVEDISYTYDGADRTSVYSVSITSGFPPLIATQTYGYDDLGRLSSISRPFTFGYVNYTYDLHGWMTGITTDSFCEELFYASGPGSPRYNGNVSSMRWENHNYYRKRGYKFTYDNANRLTQATYGEGTNITYNSGRFSESVQYEAASGNIKRITRNGKNSSSGYGQMDNLTLSYDGYRLTGVSETVTDYSATGTFEYKGANGSEYLYDANGALVADRSRGIAYIDYDFNGNPQTIYFLNGNEIRYTYTAAGEKLCAKYCIAAPNVTRTFGVKPEGYTSGQVISGYQYDYLMGGSLILWDGLIDKVLFDGGYANGTPVNNSTTYEFALHYYNKDHLGSNREVVSNSGVVQQVTNYYPFGAPYADPNAVVGSTIQPFKYNGKELETMHGLNTYDYGARQYDPITIRWDRMDPLCEKNPDITPYHFCHNNPVNKIDPNGKDDYYTRDGTYLGTNKAITDNIYITGEDQYRKLEDGKYAINMSSRVAINDTELDAEAYSKIFTNSLRLGGYNTSNLSGGKIQVTVWHMEGGSKVSDNYTENASSVGSALATTNSDHDNGARITAYIWPQGTEERELFSTRSNIISCIGDHEFKGHYQLGYKHEENTSDRIYRMQKNSPNWNKTTIQFKNYINKIIKDNGWE